MADDFYGFDEEEEEEKGRDNLFLWTVFILLLIGVAFACWLGSFYIFGHPERPWCYKVLKKMGKIDAPKRFEVTAGPLGDFMSPQKFFEKYSKYTPLELENENAELLRNYIKNYRETKKLVPYMTGRYSIISAQELKPGEMFASGVVALAQSIDYPQVLIEHLYPAAKESVPMLRKMLPTGLDMKIERTNDLSAVIHIERVSDGRLQATLVPLLYGTYALKQGVGTFRLEPPTDLNMEGGVPLIKEREFKEALAGYARFRRNRPLDERPDAAATAGPELVRVETTEPGSKVPESGALPEMPVATPIPIAGGTTPRPVVPAPTPRIAVVPATPPVILAMVATPAPRPVATPIPIATPAPLDPAAAPPRVSPTGVPLQPFLAAAPAPGDVPRAATETWRTYPPGRAPAARAVTPGEASSLTGRDLDGRMYLRGDFRVTASGDNRAVLRPRADSPDAAAENVRIMVEFPAGAIPPALDANVSRDVTHPLQILDVRRAEDGTLNIYAREITAQ